MRVLVVNTGSSSLKLSVLDSDDTVLTDEHLENWDHVDQQGITDLLGQLDPVDAVGHRVVHGGERFSGPVVIDDAVEEEIAGLATLAPLHQPRALAAIRAVRNGLPRVPSVSCFDTAFHATLPLEAATYALPGEWRNHWSLRRYGFHGLSHAYAARRAAQMLGGSDDDLRMVSCHLGAGASLAATLGGRSIDTTMGFTPLEGLVMATRAGSVDPGLLLWLVADAGLSIEQVSNGLRTRSGLAGLTGSSGDMRRLLAARERSEPTAIAAFDVYSHRLARETAAMTAALGGIDVLVFTGGVGENSPAVRAEAATRLSYLGVRVDADKNAETIGCDGEISSEGAPVRTLVVQAREDVEIARQTRRVLTQGETVEEDR